MSSFYIEIEAAERYVFTLNQVQYAGDLLDNRKSSVVSHIDNFKSTDPSNFQLQIAGESHYSLTFNNGNASIAVSRLQRA